MKTGFCFTTDGVSTTDHRLTIPYARIAQRRGIKMIAIGVTDDSDTEELSGIASDASMYMIYELHKYFQVYNLLIYQFVNLFIE